MVKITAVEQYNTAQHKPYILKTCGSIYTKYDSETGESDGIIQNPVHPLQIE